MKIKFYSPLSTNIGEAIDYQDKIDASLKKDNCDLADYADEYHGDSYYKKLHSCKIEAEAIDGVLYGVAVCEVDDDWNDTDTAQMKKYLTGQYSDGWGEGFEQHEIDEYEDEYTDYYENEDGEENEYTETETCGIYCSFWDGNPEWCIKTESEMKRSL